MIEDDEDDDILVKDELIRYRTSKYVEEIGELSKDLSLGELD